MTTRGDGQKDLWPAKIRFVENILSRHNVQREVLVDDLPAGKYRAIIGTDDCVRESLGIVTDEQLRTAIIAHDLLLSHRGGDYDLYAQRY
jgi:hypothetical protein